MHAADARERDFLRKDDMREQVGWRAAILFEKTDAEQSGCGGLPVKLARKLLGLVPCSSMRHDFARNESPHRVAQRLVLIGERRMRLHAGSSSTSKCPGATCAPGATCTAFTRAAGGTLSACAICMASGTTRAFQAAVVSPAFAWTAPTRPFIGAISRPSLAAALRRAGGACAVFSRRKLLPPRAR